MKEHYDEYPGDPHPHAVTDDDGKVVAQFSDIETARAFAAMPELINQASNALAYIETNRPKGDIRKNFSAINEHENAVCKPLRAAIASASGQD